MAEGIFRKMLEEKGLPGTWQVSSAGTLDLQSSPASENSVLVMAEQGIDIHRHVSRPVSRALLENSSLILTMAEEHLLFLREAAPQVSSRLFMISEMTGVVSDVDDPIGEDIPEYRRAAVEIRDYLEKGFDRILNLAASSGIPSAYRAGEG